jgi:4-methyl-5(b-hydroxyethyl)-thiazole monophosphate biosynthesis
MKSEPKQVLVPLAPGFEEIEAVTIIDVLRRAGIEVRVAGLTRGAVRGSHGIEVGVDCTLDEVRADELVMLVLPGGMPGTRNLREDARVLGLVRALEADGRTVAAICAAPTVLAAAGVLSGRRATSHPSVRAELTEATVLAEPCVVRSGPLVTSQGVGTALEFALALVEELRGSAKAGELRRAMLVPDESRAGSAESR